MEPHLDPEYAFQLHPTLCKPRQTELHIKCTSATPYCSSAIPVNPKAYPVPYQAVPSFPPFQIVHSDSPLVTSVLEGCKGRAYRWIAYTMNGHVT